MSDYSIVVDDSNIEILNMGYHEYLTPTTKLPIYDIGISAKVISPFKRYGRNAELLVHFWATIGPNTDNPTFNHSLINSYKSQSKTSKFKKKFANPNIGELFEKTGVDINSVFNAYHSYLVITDWYSEVASKGYF